MLVLFRGISAALLILLVSGICLPHEAPGEAVEFIEKRGSNVPLDLYFKDESGREVTLQNLMNDRPAILTLVYFHCPEACNPLLNNITEALDNINIDPSKFVIMTVSINPGEDPDVASQKKKEFFNAFKKPFPEDSWKFLTGSEQSIAKLADSVGYGFRKEGDDYVHPLGVIFISPGGKITRYLHGTYFLPVDFQMGLLEASRGKVGSPIVRAFSICYGYNPSSGKYALNIARITGIVTLFFAAIFLLFLFGRRKKKKGEI